MWILVTIYGVLAGYVAAQLWITYKLQGSVELPQGATFGVRTKLTEENLRNWNIGNFAARTFTLLLALNIGGSAVCFAMLTYVFAGEIFVPLAVMLAILLPQVILYVARKQTADRAIKEHGDEY